LDGVRGKTGFLRAEWNGPLSFKKVQVQNVRSISLLQEGGRNRVDRRRKRPLVLQANSEGKEKAEEYRSPAVRKRGGLLGDGGH